MSGGSYNLYSNPDQWLIYVESIKGKINVKKKIISHNGQM